MLHLVFKTYLQERVHLPGVAVTREHGLYQSGVLIYFHSPVGVDFHINRM